MATNEEIRQPKPPYAPFKTVVNFITKLKETTVPPRIDRTMLRNFSNAIIASLIPALKFLSLIDDDGNTQERLRALVASYGTDTWKETLKETINSAYAPIIGDLDISCATKGMLEERFKETGAEKSVISKCIAFYVTAQREAGVGVSPHITEVQRAKRDPAKKKVPKPREGQQSMDSAMSQFLGGIDKKRMPGTVNFNIPVLPGKPPVQILIPENITDVEWKIINATMEGYISLLQGKKES